MAQVAQLGNKRDERLVRKQFDKLLKDSKNQEFKDKIYFELGEFGKKQTTCKRPSRFQTFITRRKEQACSGMAFLRIGQIDFDSLKKYKLAKSYYDSAVGACQKILKI